MSKTIKKIISIVLVIILALPVYVSAFAVNGIAKASLSVSPSKSKYSWNENINFTVTVSNDGNQPIDFATVSVSPEFSKYFSVQSSDTTVTNLPVGESKEISVSLKSNCNFFIRIFMPIIKLFGIGKTSGYNSESFNTTSTVKIGITNFEFGFDVDLGYNNSTAEKEIENLKKLNGNKLPDIYMDDEDGIPGFIDGKFSEDTISNENDALRSLEDIQKLMEFKNVNDELNFYQKDTYDNNTFYRFQQYYNGIEVYGKNVIVVTDKNKKTSAMSNDYEPGISLNTTPTIDENKALNVAKSYISNCNNANVVGLRIYATDMDPTLVYMVSCNGTYENSPFSGYVFVDADLGTVVSNVNTLSYETVSATSNGKTFNVWKNNSGSYELEDRERNIKVYDAQKAVTIVYQLGGNFYSISPENPITSTSRNMWDAEAATMMSNLSGIYDYYKNHYGRKSFSGNNGRIIAVINDGATGLGVPGKNGYSFSESSWDTTVIAIGYVTGCSRYDVLAHEYLHSTERYIADMQGGDNETGGLKEAYADIMGEVLEASVLNGHIDWMHGTSRNIANPSQTGNPSKVPSKYTSKECHYISTIVSHAAYLMQQDKISNAEKLGELWYRSIYYLDENAAFVDCRAAVIAAAGDMGMSTAEIDCIKTAFSKVGIEGTGSINSGIPKVSGKITNAADGSAVSNASIKFRKNHGNTSGEYVSGANTTTDSAGKYSCDKLTEGNYTMEVSKAGFVTGYFNVIASPSSNICENQNFSISPESSEGWSYSAGTQTLTVSGNGSMKDYSSFGSAPWYKYSDSIKKVVINSGVTSIGNYAFAQCTNIESVSIPNTVTKIGTASFYECNSLQSLTLPNSVKSIADYAFYDCYSLSKFTSGSVETIGMYAFAQCDALKSVTFSSSTKSIGNSAFAWCDNLKSITINNKNCTVYDSVNTIPEGVTINAPSGSNAQSYANKYGRSFSAI